MAPRGAVKARDYDYSNVGKAGRRTGITLREGRRDEHGMEELDGMFSSPEKSPMKSNGLYNGNDTIIGSEGMSMDEGSAPGPADFLVRSNGRRSSYFPPPVARSPMKTGLTGSPRRTPGVRSSPAQQSDELSSSPTSGRERRSKANEAIVESARSARRPLVTRRPNTPPISNASRNKGKEKEHHLESATTGRFSDNENNPVQSDEDSNEHSGFNDDLTENLPIPEIENDFGDDSGDLTAPADEMDEEDLLAEESPSIIASGARRFPEQKSAAKNTGNGLENGPSSSPKRKRPGRPPKAQSNVDKVEADQRPKKKAKTARTEPAQATLPLHPELDKVVENYTNRTGPLKGRSLYILKRETPSDDKSTHTRSGRVSVRPLAYWRNERCVYGDGEAGVGQRYPLSTIKEIIRTEELQPDTTKAGKRKSQKRSKSRKARDDRSDDEDEDERDVDEWERETGVLHGYIRKWDPESQAGTAEEEVLDIAYAPSGIETRPVKDSTFRFAKLLSSPFIGSGVVDIPPGGVKRPKNSKRMHMVFYVCYGRVQVDISGVQFSAGKGCVFQVPRGNHYSFANTFHKDARLFFTQGCVPIDGESSNSKPAVSEQEFANDGPRPKGRGRGRSKVGSGDKD